MRLLVQGESFMLAYPPLLVYQRRPGKGQVRTRRKHPEAKTKAKHLEAKIKLC
jgi:hypothetical protein